MQHSFYFHENRGILVKLSHPDRQRKGGVSLGDDSLFFNFCHGKCYQPSHLQMARQKKW